MIHKEHENTVVKAHQETCETIPAVVVIPMDRRKEHPVLVVPIPMNRTTLVRVLPAEVVEAITVVLPPDPTAHLPEYPRVEDARVAEVLLVVEVLAEEDNSYT